MQRRISTKDPSHHDSHKDPDGVGASLEIQNTGGDLQQTQYHQLHTIFSSRVFPGNTILRATIILCMLPVCRHEVWAGISAVIFVCRNLPVIDITLFPASRLPFLSSIHLFWVHLNALQSVAWVQDVANSSLEYLMGSLTKKWNVWIFAPLFLQPSLVHSLYSRKASQKTWILNQAAPG